MRVVMVANETRGTMLAERVQVAATSVQRAVGLLGRKDLNPGEGLWIWPSSGVHTFGRKFASDVVGRDAQRRVIRVWRRVAPWRLTGLHLRVKSVVELPAGAIAETGICLGDVLRFG